MKKAIILEFVSIILLSIFQVFSEEVKPKIKLIYGKWGNNPGEFGFIPPKIGSTGDMDEPGQGPNDFYVDENDFVYILDNVNKRVQVFDKNGKFIRIDKDLYEEVFKRGTTSKTIIDGKDIEVEVGLVFEKKPRWELEEPTYWGCEIKNIEVKGLFAKEITFLNNGRKIMLISKDRAPFRARILGIDKENNIYIGIFASEGIYPEIVKVRKDKGEIVGKIQIGIDSPDYYYTTSLIRISPRGDIYTMNSDHSGFWIDCYPTELFDKPEGRDFTYLYPKKKNQK